MLSEPRWLVELYRIGAIRRFLASIKTALLVSSGMLVVAALVEYWPVRFAACLTGAYFTASALGALSALTEKIDRESGDGW